MHHRLRRALQAVGGNPTAWDPKTYPSPSLAHPFATAELLEHDAVRAVDVGGPAPPPPDVGFLDGIQRYVVAGWLGLAPVVRGYVAAAVLRRDGGTLRAVASEREEFLVVPLARVSADARRRLDELGLRVYDVSESDRAHPVRDVQQAALVVERRREAAERAVAAGYLAARSGEWLVVDGAITGLADAFAEHPGLVGLIKSHETQFLAGRDLAVVLNLPAGHRSSVFARESGQRVRVRTWYLRLWPWEDRDVLHGLVRLERPPASADDATPVSRWILAERAPLAGTDSRWDRLIYPIHHVEAYLRAQAGNW